MARYSHRLCTMLVPLSAFCSSTPLNCQVRSEDRKHLLDAAARLPMSQVFNGTNYYMEPVTRCWMKQGDLTTQHVHPFCQRGTAQHFGLDSVWDLSNLQLLHSGVHAAIDQGHVAIVPKSPLIFKVCSFTTTALPSRLGYPGCVSFSCPLLFFSLVAF